MDRHFSALIFACCTNQLECLRILFEHGMKHTSQSHEKFVNEWIGGKAEQWDCLFFAVKNNNADMLSYLLNTVKLGSRVNDHKKETGCTLLHIAAENGNERIIFELAGDEPGFGADVTAEDFLGNTPLHVAALKKQPSAARFLMSLGAQIETRNQMGNTPLHLSV